ncbi:MAG: hypothetical protein GX444_06605 [Myxococcales bacterium]|nr:hypothetical protein [Myxococcales bacterium]
MASSFTLPQAFNAKYWLRWTAIVASLILLQVGLLLFAGAVYRGVVNWRSAEAAAALPDPNVALGMPRALAAFPRFRFEWWRLAGRLTDEAGKIYGFSFRFDRINEFDWSDLWWRRSLQRRDHYTAYLAVAEIGGEQFYLSRRRDDAAVALSEHFDLRLAGWRLSQSQLPLVLDAPDPKTGLNLTAVPDKKPVLFGDHGYQWRGAAGAPVYLAGLPALDLDGMLTWKGQRKSVRGSGFFEHEFTSYRLPAATPGWDRVFLSLNNNYQLLLVRLRAANGASQSDAPLAVILPDSETMEFRAPGYDCQPSLYQAEKSGRNAYPIAWNMRLEHYQADLRVKALMPGLTQRRAADQQRSWEGLCEVEGSWRSWPVRGTGFIELTGYPVARTLF